MQKRIKSIGLRDEARIFVLKNYWNKTYMKLQMKATKIHDKQMNEILLHIAKIPDSVRTAMLV